MLPSAHRLLLGGRRRGTGWQWLEGQHIQDRGLAEGLRSTSGGFLLRDIRRMESWRRRRAWGADPRSRRSSRPTSFVFITTSHNSGQFVQKNLESIAMQQYPAFRIQYVDDACTDDTLAQLVDFRARHPRLDMTILRNKERMGPAYSRWRACAAARDHEVCVFLDGDDTLLHPRVLAVLDRVYGRE